MNKLNPIQIKVLSKMKENMWYYPYELKTKVSILNELVDKGYCTSRSVGTVGESFSPQTDVEYKRVIGLYLEIG